MTEKPIWQTLTKGQLAKKFVSIKKYTTEMPVDNFRYSYYQDQTTGEIIIRIVPVRV